MSMNVVGTWTLFKKESARFLRVAVQTVITPMLTAALYLLVFVQVLDGRLEPYPGVSYVAFLIPGLMMMSATQNAFANTSSSLIQAKMQGGLIWLLLAPLSSLEIFVAYIASAILRGVLVAFGVAVAAMFFAGLHIDNIALALLFLILSSGVLAVLGLIAGMWADRYDQLAAFQNFIIMPLSFLSGVFYSVNSLPEIWAQLSRFNPFFYMIDGLRYGFLGVSDVSVTTSLAITSVFFVVLTAICLQMLRSGYKLRH